MKVVAAAIRKDGVVYTLPPPARHHVLIELIFKKTGRPTRLPDEQGFMLDDGTFVGRPEALKIARAAGQVTEIVGSVLTSEDLW